MQTFQVYLHWKEMKAELIFIYNCCYIDNTLIFFQEHTRKWLLTTTGMICVWYGSYSITCCIRWAVSGVTWCWFYLISGAHFTCQSIQIPTNVTYWNSGKLGSWISSNGNINNWFFPERNKTQVKTGESLNWALIYASVNFRIHWIHPISILLRGSENIL